MKFNKNLVALSLATAFTASVSASDVLVTGEFTIPLENVEAAVYDVNMDPAVMTPNGNALGATISYQTSFGLNTGDILTFTLSSGALYIGDDFVLVADEAAVGVDVNNDGDMFDIVEVATNFGAVNMANGVSFVEARINNNLTLPAGITLVLQENNALVVDLGTAGPGLAATANLPIRFPMGTTAPFTVTSSAVTSGNVTIGAAADVSPTIVDFERQITASISMPATSTIEISADSTSRTQFLEEGAAGDVLTSNNDTDLTQSAATFTFDNDSDSTVEDFFVTNAADEIDVTITGTNLGNLSAVAGASFLEFGSGTVDDATDFDLVVGAMSLTANVPNLLANAPARGAAAASDDIVLTVDGTVLSDRTFNTTFAIDFDDGRTVDLADSNIINDMLSHTWVLDGGGALLHTPNASLNSNFFHRVTLSSRSGQDANYRVTAVAESGCTATVATGFADGSAVLPANSSLSLFVTDVVTDVTCTTGGNPNIVALTFDIEASDQDIQGIIQLVDVANSDVVTSNYLIRNGTN